MPEEKPEELTVSNILGLRQVRGDIGLEIEVEGRRLPVFNQVVGIDEDTDEEIFDEETESRFWRQVRDGSLRGQEAWEYVFHNPLSIDGTKQALDELDTQFKRCGSQISNSMRAGVHVHVNVTNLTPREMFTFAAAYYLLEEVLSFSCGVGRQGNHHALRLIDAYDVTSYIQQTLEMGNLNNLRTNDIRYAALNWASLGRHGSLEFRQKGTNDGNTKDILDWAAVLLSIKENAVSNFRTPSEVIRTFSGQGGEQIVRLLLPDEELAEKYVFSVVGWQQSMRDYSRLVQDFAFIVDTEEEWRKTFPSRRLPRSFLQNPMPTPLERAVTESSLSYRPTGPDFNLDEGF